MDNKRLILAVAGSGKTYYIVQQLNEDNRFLLITYTISGTDNLINEIVKRFTEIKRARLVVTGQMAQDQITLKVEVNVQAEGLAERIAEMARDVTKLRVNIEACAVGSLPNDGKVIEDARSYQ